MGADYQVIFSVFERGFGFALFFRRHGAGKLTYAYAKGAQTLPECGAVLLCQNFCGCHECAHISALRTLPYKCGSYKGFTAAHVALDKAIHYIAGIHISHGLTYSSPLGISGCEGEGIKEKLNIPALHFYAAFAYPFTPHAAKRAGENKQLLKDYTSAGKGEGIKIRGKMNVFIGVRCLRQLTALTN